MKKIILSISLLFITGYTFSQGLILDEGKYKKLEQWRTYHFIFHIFVALEQLIILEAKDSFQPAIER